MSENLLKPRDPSSGCGTTKGAGIGNRSTNEKVKGFISVRLPYLHQLINSRRLSDLEDLLRGPYKLVSALVDERDSFGFCGLHRACATGQQAIVETLLLHGADPKCLDSTGGACMYILYIYI
mmetsp:Transcript_3941/g.4931  ORF Transcript_3941/g.4931 Transcript_3941/m.4931 type:complete len:122 (-) Transcript_3941:22-387(-)